MLFVFNVQVEKQHSNVLKVEVGTKSLVNTRWTLGDGYWLPLSRGDPRRRDRRKTQLTPGRWACWDPANFQRETSTTSGKRCHRCSITPRQDMQYVFSSGHNCHCQI
ncbi:hypothetical protein EYF80_010481 [Liparis tanakae]|uniref:Uncharacterized protein n=1 Tax=Liparis tanakae TaxID=230148 RepID=A0A4Z2IMY0_9TELE|nr:hypothetical protein EYF80_010481 [Liparis tanakae]